jgi:hypothetical protein
MSVLETKSMWENSVTWNGNLPVANLMARPMRFAYLGKMGFRSFLIRSGFALAIALSPVIGWAGPDGPAFLRSIPPPAAWDPEREIPQIRLRTLEKGNVLLEAVSRVDGSSKNPVRALREFRRAYSESERFAQQTQLERENWVPPNELFPQDSLPILKQAPAGAYVTVGTERGFISAANSPQVSHLVLLDIEANAVRFNEINVALLQAARDREDYLRLRMAADGDTWRIAAATVGDERSRALLSDPKAWDWWRNRVRNLSADGKPLRSTDLFEPLHRPENAWNGKLNDFHARSDHPFEGVSYLEHDALFHRVHQMAKSGRIRSLRMDLGDPQAMKGLAQALVSEKVPLSVLDLSNTHAKAFLGQATAGLLDAMAPAASPESVLVATVLKGDDGVRTYRWSYARFRWRRIAAEGGAIPFYRRFFSWDHLRDAPVASIENELVDLDGPHVKDPTLRELFHGMKSRLCNRH